MILKIDGKITGISHQKFMTNKNVTFRVLAAVCVKF